MVNQQIIKLCGTTNATTYSELHHLVHSPLHREHNTTDNSYIPHMHALIKHDIFRNVPAVNNCDLKDTFRFKPLPDGEPFPELPPAPLAACCSASFLRIVSIDE